MPPPVDPALAARPSLLLSRSASRLRRLASWFGQTLLLLVTSLSLLAVLGIIFFIAKDALPFFININAESIAWFTRAVYGRINPALAHEPVFNAGLFAEFFTSARWYPSREPAEFGALSIFYGSALVTLGAILFAVPLGICSAVCLSDILPFSLRQTVKPVVEVLASIPSVAYGFFALVILAPLLQTHGGPILMVSLWAVGLPVGALLTVVASDMLAGAYFPLHRARVRPVLLLAVGLPVLYLLWSAGNALHGMTIPSGTNALNASFILGIMALPTVVSVSEDALQAAGVELRMASYGLGATRTETILKTVLPAAASGIAAAVLLGIMRAIGETMVVWMASGNAAQIPTPWYDITSAVRTLTATIAGDMGEADQSIGSSRYHVLFAMALCLLLFSFFCNLASERVIKRNRRKLKGG